MCFDSAWPGIEHVLSQYLLNNNDYQLSSTMAGSSLRYSNVTSYMAQTGMEQTYDRLCSVFSIAYLLLWVFSCPVEVSTSF